MPETKQTLAAYFSKEETHAMAQQPLYHLFPILMATPMPIRTSIYRFQYHLLPMVFQAINFN